MGDRRKVHDSAVHSVGEDLIAGENYPLHSHHASYSCPGATHGQQARGTITHPGDSHAAMASPPNNTRILEQRQAYIVEQRMHPGHRPFAGSMSRSEQEVRPIRPWERTLRAEAPLCGWRLGGGRIALPVAIVGLARWGGKGRGPPLAAPARPRPLPPPPEPPRPPPGWNMPAGMSIAPVPMLPAPPCAAEAPPHVRCAP